MKNYIRLSNETIWANPNDPNEVAYRAIHNPELLTKDDIYYLRSCLGAYQFLINHPAMTLKAVAKQVSMIRKATNNKSLKVARLPMVEGDKTNE